MIFCNYYCGLFHINITDNKRYCYEHNNYLFLSLRWIKFLKILKLLLFVILFILIPVYYINYIQVDDRINLIR